MKKVLIIGGTGMAGHVMYYYLDSLKKYRMFNTVYRNRLTADSIICDVTVANSVKAVLDSVKPDYIINCVGALIRQSRSNPADTIYLNAFFPHKLKELAELSGSKLVHISTDCVFSGKKGDYSETDFRDADDVYGRSKALGEIFDENHATLRTSIIGPELKTDGEGLFHWFMKQSGEIKGYTEAFWSGVTTMELARAAEHVLSHNLTGLFHVSNGDPISKYELLKLFKDEFENGVSKIEPFENYSANKTLKPSGKFDFEVPGYEKMIKEMGRWMKQEYPELYKNDIR
jgi:dTDP-4-dehydrorhamnose reductase